MLSRTPRPTADLARGLSCCLEAVAICLSRRVICVCSFGEAAAEACAHRLRHVSSRPPTRGCRKCFGGECEGTWPFAWACGVRALRRWRFRSRFQSPRSSSRHGRWDASPCDSSASQRLPVVPFGGAFLCVLFFFFFISTTHPSLNLPSLLRVSVVAPTGSFFAPPTPFPLLSVDNKRMHLPRASFLPSYA